MRTPSGKRKSNHKKKDENLEISDDEVEDISIIGNSLTISIKGVRELIRAISVGTQEFREVMENECSLIYECKVCQSLFRSVANFISHKRQYCKKKYHSFNHGFHNNEPETGNLAHEKIEIVNGCDSESNKKRKKLKLSRMECPPCMELLSPESAISCKLENTSQTSTAVFQTLANNQKTSSIRQELREMELCSSPQATILPDGSTLVAGNGGKFKCSVCQSEFPTSRALERHSNVYHQTRSCYPCPLCKVYFVSPWCVYRHLNKVHHKKEDQIRRLRNAVLSKVVKRELYQPTRGISEIQTVTAINASKRAEDEKWIAQFEGELHCKLCNKSFSRRAALNVHSIMCKSRGKAPKSAEKSQTADNLDSLRCQKCKKQFLRRAVLASHQASCTGNVIRPIHVHICKYCSRSYPRRRPLTLHMSICPRAPPRSPLKHLLTPPKLSAAPKQQLSSPAQLKCDYDKMPSLFPRNGMIAPVSSLSSKLEAVVQKLRDNPSKTTISTNVMTQGKNNSAFNNAVLNMNSRYILGPSMSQSTFNVRKGVSSNGNLYFSVPSNGSVSSGPHQMPIIANLIPVIDLDPIIISNTKYNLIPKDSLQSQFNSAKLNKSVDSLTTVSNKFLTIKNKCRPSKSLSPPIVNKIIQSRNETVTSTTNCFTEVLKARYSDNSKINVGVITVANSSLSSKTLNYSSSSSSVHTFIQPSTNVLVPSQITVDSSSEGDFRDSLYSTPIHFTDEYHQETDLDALSSASRESEHSEENTSIVADDSGVSDDGCLPENLHQAKCSPFKGFDPPTVQELLPAKRLSSLVNYLDSQIKHLK